MISGSPIFLLLFGLSSLALFAVLTFIVSLGVGVILLSVVRYLRCTFSHLTEVTEQTEDSSV